MPETDSFEKNTPENCDRRALITLNGVGPHLPPSTSCHLMQPSSEVDKFTFNHSFWQAHYDKLKMADDSDNCSNCHHILPDQGYQNVTKKKVIRK